MKQALLVGLAGLMAAGITSSAFFPANANTSDTTEASETSSSVDTTALKERVWDTLQDLYGGNNYTYEYEYLGRTYQDIVNPSYILVGGTTSAYVMLPSYDGSYENIAYNADVRYNANGTKNIELLAPMSDAPSYGSDTTDFPGDALYGSGSNWLYGPYYSIEEYDPLSYTNSYGSSWWGTSFTEDTIVDLPGGRVGVLTWSGSVTTRMVGIYMTMCARMGFYDYDGWYYMGWHGRYGSIYNARNSSRPYAVAFDYDANGDFVASILMLDDEGNAYVPDEIGTGVFKDIGSTEDPDFEEMLNEGAGNFSKKSLSYQQVRNVMGESYSANTVFTNYLEYMGQTAEDPSGTYYIDYNQNCTHAYSDDDPIGTYRIRGEDDKVGTLYRDVNNVVEARTMSGNWRGIGFAYNWIEPNAWRYHPSTDTYRYYGYNANRVCWALNGFGLPSFNSRYTTNIVSLEMKLKDGKVSTISALTNSVILQNEGELVGLSIWRSGAVTEVQDEVRPIVLPTPFERDDSYEDVKAAFDLHNDKTQTYTVRRYEVAENATPTSYTDTTYAPNVALVKNYRVSGTTTTVTTRGYLYRENVGIIPFDVDENNDVTASGPTLTDRTIDDYRIEISANPDIMTYNSGKTGFVLKGEVHYLSEGFPTITGDGVANSDLISDLSITMGENNQISKIEYETSSSLLGTISYDWTAGLPEGMAAKLEAMEEFVAPTSWTASVSYNWKRYTSSKTLADNFATYLTNLNTLTGGSTTIDDIPYVYDPDAESYSSTTRTSYSSGLYTNNMQITLRNWACPDLPDFQDRYIARCVELGFTQATYSSYTFYSKDYINIRFQMNSAQTALYIYFTYPGKEGTPAVSTEA